MPMPKTPALTTDCVILDAQDRLLLIRRKHDPFINAFALPGGFVDVGETVEDGCRREVMEETGVKVGKLRLVGVYSDPSRDPRGHTCTVAYLARVKSAQATAGDDAADAVWVSNWRRATFAFDHRKIIGDAMRLDAATRAEKAKA